MAINVELRRQQLPLAVQHLDVNVRCASGIGRGLDGPKAVPAVLISDVVAEALESFVAWNRAVIARVEVFAVDVALPDSTRRPARGAPSPVVSRPFR